MFLPRKVFTVAIVAASFSGTAAVPATTLFAAPAPDLAAVETAAITPQLPAIAPVLPAPAPAVEASDTDRSARATASADDRELECLTRVMLYEAGNEGEAGQLAVAHVVMNRVRSSRFPDSVCSVIYQRGQFSSIRSFSHARNGRWNRAQALARDVLAGQSESNVGAALYFHASRVSPSYVQSRVRVGRVGNHIFYR